MGQRYCPFCNRRDGAYLSGSGPDERPVYLEEYMLDSRDTCTSKQLQEKLTAARKIVVQYHKLLHNYEEKIKEMNRMLTRTKEEERKKKAIDEMKAKLDCLPDEFLQEIVATVNEKYYKMHEDEEEE